MVSHWILPRRAARPCAPAASRPLWNLDRFFRDLALLDFPDLSSRERAFSPAVDVDETDDEIRISAELPGLEHDDFSVTTEQNCVTIKGEKKFEAASEARGRTRVERASGPFERSFQFAWEIDPESVKAVYKNGVLELAISKPREAGSQARTIPVTAS
ncbi:MAG TPA: Hsp20/alpha crystallin family protein [Myxococcota bacterium]|nr:Hsp20/alpha crystallin family protein [Myxococcota bacterium]